MIRQKETHRGSRSCNTALFIAGLPSQVSIDTVLTYFLQIAPCFSLLPDSNQKQMERHAKKGCCVIQCHDPKVAQSILAKRFLDFCGRTLTIMQQKSGVGLIIQNKKLKKCRVILKKVPRYLGETHLRLLLESQVGPLQILFQLKCNDPFDQHLQSKTEGSRFQTFSAYFSQPQDARRLLALGSITLQDGSKIIAHKHTEQDQRKDVTANSPNRVCNQNSYSESGQETEGKQPVVQELQISKMMMKMPEENDAASHQVKPTQKKYYFVSELGRVRRACVMDKTKAHYRLNNCYENELA